MGGKSPPTAIRHRDEIIRRVSEGEYLQTVAQSLGLKGKGQAICNVLANDPEYQIARERGLEFKLEMREVELERSEPESVPRARELLSHARWRAEREAPHRWGAKGVAVTVQVTSVGDLVRERASDLLGRAERVDSVASVQQIIDAQPDPEVDSA